MFVNWYQPGVMLTQYKAVKLETSGLDSESVKTILKRYTLQEYINLMLTGIWMKRNYPCITKRFVIISFISEQIPLRELGNVVNNNDFKLLIDR